MPPLWPGQDSMRAVFRSPDLVILKPAVSPKAKPPYRTTSSAPPPPVRPGAWLLRRASIETPPVRSTPDVGANPDVPWRPPGLHSHELHTLPARRARATASRVSTLPGQSAQSTASWVGQGWKRAGMDAARPPVFYLKRQHVDSSSCRQPRRRRRRALVRSMRLEQQCRPVIIIIITIAVEPRYRPAGASQIGRPCAAGWVWYRHESSYERAWGPGIKPGTRAGLLGAKPKGPKHPSIRVPVCSC